VTAAVAWWFLSALLARGVDDHHLAWRAFLWLAAESLLTAAAYFLQLAEYLSVHVAGSFVLTTFRISPSIEGVGAVVQTVGFVLMMLSYSKNPPLDPALTFDSSLHDEGDIALEQP
jgi:hypothetical protein